MGMISNLLNNLYESGIPKSAFGYKSPNQIDMSNSAYGFGVPGVGMSPLPFANNSMLAGQGGSIFTPNSSLDLMQRGQYNYSSPINNPPLNNTFTSSSPIYGYPPPVNAFSSTSPINGYPPPIVNQVPQGDDSNSKLKMFIIMLLGFIQGQQAAK